jgi:hypothetical protein
VRSDTELCQIAGVGYNATAETDKADNFNLRHQHNNLQPRAVRPGNWKMLSGGEASGSKTSWEDASRFPAAARYSLPRYCAIVRCPLTGSTQLSATRPVAIFRTRDSESQKTRSIRSQHGLQRGGQEPADNCMCNTKAKLRCPRVLFGEFGLDLFLFAAVYVRSCLICFF